MYGDSEISIFSVQLTTSRVGNLTRLILNLAICDNHTYIYDAYMYFRGGPLQNAAGDDFEPFFIYSSIELFVLICFKKNQNAL